MVLWINIYNKDKLYKISFFSLIEIFYLSPFMRICVFRIMLFSHYHLLLSQLVYTEAFEGVVTLYFEFERCSYSNGSVAVSDGNCLFVLAVCVFVGSYSGELNWICDNYR